MEITDTHIKVALSRHLGESRKTAGSRAGVPETTIQHWESCPWWADAQAIAAKTHGQKTLGKARRVVNKILDSALEDDCPASILNQAANLSRWVIETQDPDFKSNNATDESKALVKLANQLATFSDAELRALANEPVILGFPADDDDTQDSPSENPVRSTQASSTD